MFGSFPIVYSKTLYWMPHPGFFYLYICPIFCAGSFQCENIHFITVALSDSFKLSVEKLVFRNRFTFQILILHALKWFDDFQPLSLSDMKNEKPGYYISLRHKEKRCYRFYRFCFSLCLMEIQDEEHVVTLAVMKGKL